LAWLGREALAAAYRDSVPGAKAEILRRYKLRLLELEAEGRIDSLELAISATQDRIRSAKPRRTIRHTRSQRAA
jgi:hypothetical protein